MIFYFNQQFAEEKPRSSLADTWFLSSEAFDLSFLMKNLANC
tara:strand:+ start:139 stop:264 length:126 start_codon:yes stop_codon:yes gene_type:complete